MGREQNPFHWGSPFHHPPVHGTCIRSLWPSYGENCVKFKPRPIRGQYLTRSGQDSLARSQMGGVFLGRNPSKRQSSFIQIAALVMVLIAFTPQVSSEKNILDFYQNSTQEYWERSILPLAKESYLQNSEKQLQQQQHSLQRTSFKKDHQHHQYHSDKTKTMRTHNSNHHSRRHFSVNTEKMIQESERLWVFGYGSLVWKTGFQYSSKRLGFVTGFVRRFWQGDRTHRGTIHKPGRVATIEENKDGSVWGVAFELIGRNQIDTALEHLGLRECIIGGYTIQHVPFYDKEDPSRIIDTLVFVATPDNKDYLGMASTEQLSEEILNSRGNAGHNVEYVTRLADFLRENIPDLNDDHLLELDLEIRNRLAERQISLEQIYSKSIDDFNYMHHVSKGDSQRLIQDDEELYAESESELSSEEDMSENSQDQFSMSEGYGSNDEDCFSDDMAEFDERGQTSLKMFEQETVA